MHRLAMFGIIVRCDIGTRCVPLFRLNSKAAKLRITENERYAIGELPLLVKSQCEHAHGQ
jgi:hypothetical protein